MCVVLKRDACRLSMSQALAGVRELLAFLPLSNREKPPEVSN